MAHVKILSPTELPLSDLLGPLPKKEIRPIKQNKDFTAWALGQLKGRLEEGFRSNLSNVSLILPPGLIDAIADNVIQLAIDEPCGLKGSALSVNLIEHDYPAVRVSRLVDIKADLSTPTTHILEVRLLPDTTSWYTKMAYIFRSLTKRRIVISHKYELRKFSILD